MNRASSSHAAFHLIGERPAGGESSRPDQHPALFGGFRDLAELRHDYPLVLAGGDAGHAPVRSLADIFDDLLRTAVPPEQEGEQMRRQVRHLEREMRRQALAGGPVALAQLWDSAYRRLLSDAADPGVRRVLQANLNRARECLDIDGQVLDCNAGLSAAMLTHVWTAARRADEARLRSRIELLARKLEDILEVDRLHTEKARDARYLARSVGTADQTLFDFDAMADVLRTVPQGESLPERRRRRIRDALAVLENQHFVATRLNSHGRAGGKAVFRFRFNSPGRALAAFRKRLPDITALVRAISIAELEIANRYDEIRHDPYFDRFNEESLGAEDIALFPTYLVCVGEGESAAARHGAVLEILGSGLPFKILVANDEILEELPLGAGRLTFGTRGSHLATMALGIHGVFVLQAPASSLYRLREPLLRGLEGSRPALFNVFTGANRDGMPPYLRAAAAGESRAFPGFVFDPGAGDDWAERFSLEGNPQRERDWTVHTFEYEDEKLKRHSDSVAFTLVDYLAGDPRFAAHVVPVTRDEWHAGMLPADAFLDLDDDAAAGSVPYVYLIDAEDRLRRAVVDQRLIDAARRCRDQWRSLQELGGIRNSHVSARLEEARQAWEREKEALLANPEARPAAAPAPSPDGAGITEAPVPATISEPNEGESAAPAANSDEPWIESIRCTSCNECTGINNRMFAYDADQRAYIADPDAGTYRQMVEAAESCQVCIIHPGKPRNPNEPGLEELLKRAEPFM